MLAYGHDQSCTGSERFDPFLGSPKSALGSYGNSAMSIIQHARKEEHQLKLN